VKSAPPRVLIEDVQGVAKALAKGDVWRRVRAGDSVERPTVLVTEGPDSSMTVSHNGVRVVARHEARVLLSSQGGAFSVQLDQGLVLVHSRGNLTRVYVPASQAVLTGEVFGVWAKGDHLVTAVIDGEVSLETPSISSKYAKGREIMLTSRGPIPLVLAQQLEIQVEKTEKAGGRYRLNGKTTPNAELLARRGNRYESIDVATNGTFSVEIESREPAAGDVIAYDAAGRRAEVNLPSETLDDVLTALSKGEPMQARTHGGSAPAAGAAAEEKPAAAAAEEKPAAAAVVAAKKEPEAKAAAKAEEEKPVAAAKEPAAKKEPKVENEGRGHEPSPIKIDMPSLPKDPSSNEKVEKTEKGKKATAASKKKPKAEEETETAQPEEKPAKKEPAEKKGDEEKPVELEWE
jgi:hypothetical protein